MWRLCMIILLLVVENEPRSIDEIISAALEIYDDGTTGEEAAYMPQGSAGEYVKVELDMLLPLDTWLSMNDDQNGTTQRHKRKAVKDSTQLWGDIIPYKVDDRFTAEERLEIDGAIYHWALYSCLNFREASPSDLNSINFLPTAGSLHLMCSSFVGRIGGAQTIVLPVGCREKMVIIHEIGHALGLNHEHQRTDRDAYVTIDWDKIDPYATDQFQKLTPSIENNYSIPYDYTSIMHYGKTFMSKERGLVTLVTKDPSYQDTIGEATVLSFNDIQLVNAMYQCDAGCVQKECPDGGFLGKGCSCWCRSSADWPAVKCGMNVPDGQCGVPDIDTEVYNIYTAARWDPVDLDKVQSFPNGTELNVDFKHCNCGAEFETIVCVKGNWTGQPPACQPVDICCLLPKSHDPDDTNYLYKRGNENLVRGEAIYHDETVTVLCEFMNLEDYDYMNDEGNGLMETNITCYNGTWIGERPQNCSSAPVKCSNITNGSVGNGSLWSGYVVTCDEGYQLEDVYGIGVDKFYCEPDGTWARPAPLCRPKSCKLPPYNVNAGDIVKFILAERLFLSRHDDIQHNDTVTQICPKVDFPSERTVACTLGAWNTDDGEFPLCKKGPTSPVYGSISLQYETNFTLSWAPNNDTFDKYRIVISPKPSGGSEDNFTVASIVTRRVLSGLTAATNYSVYVYTEAGGLSSLVPLIVTSYTSPLKPESVIVTDIDKHSVQINFAKDENVNFDHYSIIYHQNGQQNVTVPSTVETVPIDNLAAGTQYTFTIYSLLYGILSEHKMVVSTYTRPTSPVNGSISLQYETNFTLSWAPSNDKFDKYRIVISPKPSEGSEDNFTVASTVTSHVISGLTAATNYSVSVYTEAGGLRSLAPLIVTSYTRPTSPVNGSISLQYETNFTLSWAPSNERFNKYRIIISPKPSEGSEDNFTVASSATSHVISGLTAATNYSVSVYTEAGGLRSLAPLIVTSYTTPVKCSNITNGSVGNGSLWSGYVVTCDEGYQLEDVYGIGMDKFYCKPDGTWDGPAPLCHPTPVKCSNITNGSVGNGSLLSGYVVTCDEGYQLDDVYGIGVDKFYCEPDGTWDGAAPLCRPKSCKLPPYEENAADIVKFILTDKLFLSRHDDIQHNDIVTQICPMGDFPPEQTVTCTLGAWNTDDGEFPLCKKVRCPPPPVTNVAYYPMKKKYTFDESVDINKCRKNLEFVGDRNIRCQADSTWSGSATCRTFCKDGEVQNVEIPNMEIRAKGHSSHVYRTFDHCKKRCEKYKRFLCRSIEYGLDEDYRWKCILHPQNPESSPEILATRREWTVAYRNCTQKF